VSLKGISHVALSTPNLKRSVGFYVDVLGFEKVDSFSIEASVVANRATALDGLKADGAVVRNGPIYLEIFEFHSPTPEPMDKDRPVCDHGLTHIGIEVADLRSAYDRLGKKGMRFHSEPQTWPGGSLFVYGRDPDGNVIELIESEVGDPLSTAARD
jgi:glyoxylase I family protein